MATVSDVLAALEVLAPARYAFPFDKVGLQVGDPSAPVTRAVVSLDRSLASVDEAASKGAEMLVSHHPLIFDPVSTVTTQDHVGQTILKLAENKIAFASAHTNWDSAIGGINDALAAKLGLVDVTCFGPATYVPMLKLVVFTPLESAEAIIDAASNAGAGVIGNYSRCSFSSEGMGSFLGNELANPAVGQKGRLERVAEVRIEMVLRASLRPYVESAVREAHPYEEAAYDFYSLPDNPEQPCGRIGRLAVPVSFGEWVRQVDEQLHTDRGPGATRYA